MEKKWKEQLAEFFSEMREEPESERQPGIPDEREQEIKHFFKTTVDPVFAEVDAGFTKLGRQVTLRKARLVGHLVNVVERITIEFNRAQEFCYEIGIVTSTRKAMVRGGRVTETSYAQWHSTAYDFRQITKEHLAEEIISTYNYSVKHRPPKQE
jgi:hypothetical protein